MSNIESNPVWDLPDETELDPYALKIVQEELFDIADMIDRHANDWQGIRADRRVYGIEFPGIELALPSDEEIAPSIFIHHAAAGGKRIFVLERHYAAVGKPTFPQLRAVATYQLTFDAGDKRLIGAQYDNDMNYYDQRDNLAATQRHSGGHTEADVFYRTASREIAQDHQELTLSRLSEVCDLIATTRNIIGRD